MTISPAWQDCVLTTSAVPGARDTLASRAQKARTLHSTRAESWARALMAWSVGLRFGKWDVHCQRLLPHSTCSGELCAICDKHNPSSSTPCITRHLQRSTHAGKRQHRLSTCVSSNTTSALSVCAFAYSLKHVSSPFRFRQSSTARARRCLQQRSP